MKISGIYKIQSIIKPERCYIGSAINIANRKRDHFEKLRLNKHVNKKMQNHFNKYGEIDLVFSLLIGCEISELIKNEQFFMDSYKPWFNVRIKAESNLGIRHSKEVTAKWGEAHKGKPAWNKGLKATSIARKNQSEAHKGKRCGKDNPFFGKKHKPETIQHFKEDRKGKKKPPFTEEQGESKKGNTYRKGMTTPLETRKKQSDAAKRRYESKEERLKTSLSLIGNKNGLKKVG